MPVPNGSQTGTAILNKKVFRPKFYAFRKNRKINRVHGKVTAQLHYVLQGNVLWSSMILFFQKYSGNVFIVFETPIA